ncbi:MAG TPA: F0F1 ATP synthase subunit A, partial [Solirubrobacterales bacterium]|nr:F0F1 ATP synthase subunit A [Solirubrobacterales bacterium]
MKTKTKALIAGGVWLLIVILLLVIFGNEGKNEEFKPQNEFKLHPWISIHLGPIDLSVNRAVFYLLLASGLTITTMVWISKKMQQRPNRTQVAVEIAYDVAKNNITRGNISDTKVAARWFPFIAALFFFILFANIIGYLPLPTNTGEHFNVFGLEIPTFAIYAATANISIPIALTLVVWISYHVEG